MLKIAEILDALDPEDQGAVAYEVFRTYGGGVKHRFIPSSGGVIPRFKHRKTPLNTGLNTPENTATPEVFSGEGGTIGGVDLVSKASVSPKNLEALELLQFLNLKANRSFRPVEENLRYLRARLNTATADDIRGVIARKTRQWANTDMAKYLRPATLFKAEKFEQYMGEQGS